MSNIYFIATENKLQRFRIVKDESSYVGVLDRQHGVAHSSLNTLLAAWYSPITWNGPVSMTTIDFPNIEAQLITRENMYVYWYNIINNETKRALLPNINHRFMTAPTQVQLDKIQDGEYIAIAVIFYKDGWFCIKNQNYWLSKSFNSILDWL